MKLRPLLALLLLSACKTEPLSPAMASPPVVAAAVPQPPTMPLPDWREAPLTPGGWRYRSEAAGSIAEFGNGLTWLRCDLERRQLATGGDGIGADAKVATSFGAFTLPSALPASDSRLDGMAFSRGRFALSFADKPRLILPAWPEIGRVIEDCRG